ncbi:MAG: site-specific recombinase XerD [Planctomycetota bacterium]|nr:site-specific recombinase XerD [Planctomycetota bacterium]
MVAGGQGRLPGILTSHNAATSLRKEFGLDVARVILGHTSTPTTEIYAELDHEKAEVVMGQVG